MNYNNLTTAMVTMALSKMPGEIFGESGEEQTMISFSEGMERVFNWRQSLNLNLSIAARGATEGLWYVDLAVNPKSAWSDSLLTVQLQNAMILSMNAPKKILSFNPDISPAPFIQKLKFPDTEITHVNNQALWNWEQFMRDESLDVDGNKYCDVDYSVVDRYEIGQGEARDFNMIIMQFFETNTDSETLPKCIEALAPGGVLLLNVVNNSGKLYRDDFWFHPAYEAHRLLKSSDGLVFHNSASYGYTVFVKN